MTSRPTRVTGRIAVVFLLTAFFVPALTHSSRAVVVANVRITASSYEAWALNQTFIYSSTVTRAGVLTSITMGLPNGARLGTLRTTSGTIAQYSQPGYLIWKPASPISVAVGARLSIPVSGISPGFAGTYSLGFRAVNASQIVLSAGYGSFTVTPGPQECPASYPSDYVAQENAKPGNADWRATYHDVNKLSIYPTKQSAACGDYVYLKINSTASKILNLKVYRMGYYGGAGARLVWATQSPIVGWTQPPWTFTKYDSSGRWINFVSASNWSVTVGMWIDGDFPPGTYLFKVDNGLGHQSYAPFTVRDDTGSKHAFLMQQANTTWQAYNRWGGYSFYYPTPGSAWLTFDRPYDSTERGAGQFLGLEYGLVFWMEKQGLDVTYWSDMDLHSHPAEVAGRTRTLIVPAHDEYYSREMRQALLDAIGSGVNLVSLGANQVYRRIAPDSTGRKFLVDEPWTKFDASTTWRYRGYDFHEQKIFGAEYGCRSNGHVTTNSSFIWSGVTPGTVLEGFSNGETDWVHPASVAPVPPGLAILTTAPLNFCANSDPLKMDIVAYTAASGARVFGGSTFTWGCYVVKTCPSGWGLNISDSDALAAGQALSNVMSWADSGLPAAPGLAGATALREGDLKRFTKQKAGSLKPVGGLDSFELPLYDERTERATR